MFQALSLTDEVTVAAPRSRGWRSTARARARCPPDGTNLAWRAVEALAAHVGRTGEPKVRVVLRKGIPVAGGMAGGSADAAATLVGLASLWNLESRRDELAEIAAGLGSDVPFALYGGTALGTGRGEQLVPVLSRHTFHWVLAFDSERSVDAEGVQASWTACARRATRRGSARTAGRRGAGVGRPASAGAAAGQRPPGGGGVAAARRCAGRCGPASTRARWPGTVSGSGPTCAFLCEDARVGGGGRGGAVGRGGVPDGPGGARPGARCARGRRRRRAAPGAAASARLTHCGFVPPGKES